MERRGAPVLTHDGCVGDASFDQVVGGCFRFGETVTRLFAPSDHDDRGEPLGPQLSDLVEARSDMALVFELLGKMSKKKREVFILLEIDVDRMVDGKKMAI